MVAAKFVVRGGRRWRSLDPASGRLAGWGAARFVVVRGGRLQRAPRRAVLRGLRALAAGRPSAVRAGPRLERSPRLESSDSAVEEVNVRHCHRCCQQLNIKCSTDANFNRILKARNSAARTSVGVQTAPPAPAAARGPSQRTASTDSSGSFLRTSNRGTTKSTTEERQRPIVQKNISKRKLPPSGGASHKQVAKRRNVGKKKVNSPPADISSSQRKSDLSVDSESEQGDGESNESSAARKRTEESENNDCKELLITEEDVTLLRTFVENDAENIFDVDLRRFDEDDTYKGTIFYKLNPLVNVERCRRIAEMLRTGRRDCMAAAGPPGTTGVNHKEGKRKNIAKAKGIDDDTVIKSKAISEDTVTKSKESNKNLVVKSKEINKDVINPKNITKNNKEVNSESVNKSKQIDKDNINRSKPIDKDNINRSKPIDKDNINRSKPIDKDNINKSKQIDRDNINKSKGTNKEPHSKSKQVTLNTINKLKPTNMDTDSKSKKLIKDATNKLKQINKDTTMNSKEVNKENVIKSVSTDRIANGQVKNGHRVLKENTTATDQKISHHPDRHGTRAAVAEAGGAQRPPAAARSKRAVREYSAAEDECIVRWVAGAGRARRVNGNQLWQELQPEHERRTGLFRSWHSLRNRYLRYLLPALGSSSLSAAEASRLRAAAATGCFKGGKLTQRRNSLHAAPAERGAWARRPRPALDSSGSATPEREIEKEKNGAESSDGAGRSRSSSRSHSSPRASSSSGARSSSRSRSSSRGRSSRAGSSSRAPLPPRAMVRVPTPTYSELSRRFARRYRSTPNSASSGSDSGPGPRRGRSRRGRGADSSDDERPRAPTTRQMSNSIRRQQTKVSSSDDDGGDRRTTRLSTAARQLRGRQQADAGRQQADAGRRQADAGRRQADAGRQQADAGRQQADASRPRTRRLFNPNTL